MKTGKGPLSVSTVGAIVAAFLLLFLASRKWSNLVYKILLIVQYSSLALAIIPWIIYKKNQKKYEESTDEESTKDIWTKIILLSIMAFLLLVFYLIASLARLKHYYIR
ncbi:hypothetical protein AGMMS49579_27250 [Spirochaetia bacterium]|nr:hypothetical protein AGMMS49579_27250 [Spirochaetia bacterium]